MASRSNSPFRARKFLFRCACLTLAGGIFASSLVGCYGRDTLTNSVYRWNGEVTDNHIVNSIIMVVFAIIPVYGICIFVDAVILNSIEYWTGDETIAYHHYYAPDGSEIVLAPGSHANEAILSVYKDGNLIEQRTFLRNGDGTTQILDTNGKFLATVKSDGNDGVIFTDADGKELSRLNKSDATELAAAF